MLEVCRIENENGRGPFRGFLGSSFLPDEIDEFLREKIPLPSQDFLGDDFNSFEEFCKEKLKHSSDKVVFGFPSYNVLKGLLGEKTEEIEEYVATYKTKTYIISKSGLQVMFIKEKV